MIIKKIYNWLTFSDFKEAEQIWDSIQHQANLLDSLDSANSRISRQIVARNSRGNALLWDKRYMTKEDLDRMSEKVESELPELEAMLASRST